MGVRWVFITSIMTVLRLINFTVAFAAGMQVCACICERSGGLARTLTVKGTVTCQSSIPPSYRGHSNFYHGDICRTDPESTSGVAFPSLHAVAFGIDRERRPIRSLLLQ